MPKFTILFTIAVLLSCSSPLGEEEQLSEQDLSSREFRTVYKLLNDLYLYADRDLQPQESYEGNLNRLMDSVEDPFTGYYNPQEAEELLNYFTTPTIQKLIGIVTGNFFLVKNPSDTVTIIDVYQDSPGARAGLQIRDQILKVDETDVTGTDAETKFFDAIKNKESLSLQILRGDSSFTAAIVKEEIIIPTVISDEVADSIAYIRIMGFDEYTYTTPETPSSSGRNGSWEELVNQLTTHKDKKHLVLDFRYNPGGSVYQCLKMSAEFLAEGDTMAMIDDHTEESYVPGNFEIHTVANDGRALNQKIYLMGNEYSASCAEIMMMALRTNRNTTLVGKTTYGKGIGQSFHSTYIGGILKVTSLGIYDKTKTTYNGIGLIPDYTIEDEFEQNLAVYSLIQGKEPEITPVPNALGRKTLPIQSEATTPNLKGGAYVPLTRP